MEIIGVVEDSLYEGPREGVRRQVFWPRWGKSDATYYVRTATELVGRVQHDPRAGDASSIARCPVYGLKTVEGQLDETLLTDRLIALLSAGFGILATLLASIGLYGVMAFVVARRRKELGVRLALGAQPTGVIWLVMKEVLLLLGVGLGDRDPDGDRAGALRRVTAPRHGGARPADCGGHDGAALRRVRRRRVHPRPPRLPHRSDPGVASRVERQPTANERGVTVALRARTKDAKPRRPEVFLGFSFESRGFESSSLVPPKHRRHSTSRAWLS